MTDVVTGIKDILVEKGIATGFGPGGSAGDWRVYTDAEPSTPDNVLTVLRGGHWQPSNPKWLLDYPSVQVRVRGLQGDGPGVRAKSQDVKDALLGYPSHDRNGDRWVSVLGPAELVPLGFDGNNRPLFVVNFNLIIEPASNALTNRVSLNT